MQEVNKQEKGKLIISSAKSLKGYQLADASIATFLYATLDAGRLGLFASAIKSEKHSKIKRIQALAAQEGIGFSTLATELLPWLESAGLCEITRSRDGNILEITSLVLAYRDLLGTVSDFYESRKPASEDQACLSILEQASELPRPESAIHQNIASQYGEETAEKAIQLVKVFRIVTSSGNSQDPLLYAPRVWANLSRKAEQALSPLDSTDREVLVHLINRVRTNQGYPESMFRYEARQEGIEHLVDLSTGISLVNSTELQLADGTKRSFLTTPHFYTDLVDEFGEDMCDRVKIFLDSIRNGQYFGAYTTGKILNPEILLRALINRGRIGPATAIETDYIVAEKAGIIRVEREPGAAKAFMELGQEDTVRKVLQVVSSGSVEPEMPRMAAQHISDGRVFRSIEQGRAELGEVSGELAEIEYDIIRSLREG